MVSKPVPVPDELSGLPQPRGAKGWKLLAWPLIIGSVMMRNNVSAVILMTTSTALNVALSFVPITSSVATKGFGRIEMASSSMRLDHAGPCGFPTITLAGRDRSPKPSPFKHHATLQEAQAAMKQAVRELPRSPG